MLSCQRDRFSLPDDAHYLNCAFMSPLPRAVADAGREAMRGLEAPLHLGPEDFFRESDRVRRLFGRLVGADPEGVALVPAVSYGAATVARNLALREGATIVVVDEQFPSNVLPWRRLARERGADVAVVRRPEAGSTDRWSDRLLERIGPGTGLVAVPQAHWTDGTLFDLEAVGQRAREVGAALVVDGTQTVGAHPFRVDEVRPDALLCAGYKWLLGPYAAGCAWLGPRFRDGVPLEETWIGRAGSEDFRGLVEYTDVYREDASRFDVGERSNFILVPMLAEALELLLEWGVDEVAAYCRRLTSRVADGARSRGLEAPRARDRSANIVGLGLPAGFPADELTEELDRRRVHVSRRGSALRVSPHLYNDASDVDALLEAVDAAA